MKSLKCQQAQGRQEDCHSQEDPAYSRLKHRFVGAFFRGSNWLVCFRMDDIDARFQLRLPHEPRIQKASCGARKERTYRVQQDQARPCCRVGLILKETSYSKADRNATRAGSDITQCDVLVGIRRRCISVTVVQVCVVALVDPLPKDSIERSRCSNDKPKADGDVRRHERRKPLSPWQHQLGVWVYSCWNHCFCDSYLLNLFFGQQNVTISRP